MIKMDTIKLEFKLTDKRVAIRKKKLKKSTYLVSFHVEKFIPKVNTSAISTAQKQSLKPQAITNFKLFSHFLNLSFNLGFSINDALFYYAIYLVASFSWFCDLFYRYDQSIS